MEQHDDTLILRQRCDKCNEVLGAQNPGTRCGMCKFVEREAKRDRTN